MSINIIVAKSINNVIGKDGKIPWNIKGEQKQFKELTTGNIVIMGRRSFEEIGQPLSNRKTIVVSTTKNFEDENLITVSSLEEALVLLKNVEEDIFISGGYSLYKESIPFVDTIYMTEVDLIIEDGDTFFPDFNENEFDKFIEGTYGECIKYTRIIYKRKH